MTLQEVIEYFKTIGLTEAAEKLEKRTKEEWEKCNGNLEGSECQSSTDAFEWLSNAFDWAESPEGFDYWDNIMDKLEAKIYEHN